MKDIAERLRASVRYGAYNGDNMERAVCAKQMTEAADEINRLRAEVEALRGMREEVLHYQREFHRLRAEVEALTTRLASKERHCTEAEAEAWKLREDARRYRWLREEAGKGAPAIHVILPTNDYEELWPAICCDALDAAIDAALAKKGK